MHRADFIQSQRTAAWSAGRSLRDDLLERYSSKYRISEPPAPALIVGELITEFLGARLEYVVLPANVFAETEWTTYEKVVRLNSQTSRMSKVKDAAGVQHVAAWHECIHLTDHAPGSERTGTMLPGFEAPNRFVCRRGEQLDKSSAHAAKEFWAEEAGRAAAVSHRHLNQSEAFRELLKSADRLSSGAAWRCLYQAAKDIGVNVTALVTQLQLEGLMHVEPSGGSRVLIVQRPLIADMEPI